MTQLFLKLPLQPIAQGIEVTFSGVGPEFKSCLRYFLQLFIQLLSEHIVRIVRVSFSGGRPEFESQLGFFFIFTNMSETLDKIVVFVFNEDKPNVFP